MYEKIRTVFCSYLFIMVFRISGRFIENILECTRSYVVDSLIYFLKNRILCFGMFSLHFPFYNGKDIFNRVKFWDVWNAE